MLTIRENQEKTVDVQILEASTLEKSHKLIISHQHSCQLIFCQLNNRALVGFCVSGGINPLTGDVDII